MSQGGYVTLVGFVAREPMLRTTKDNTSVADVRIGTTSRYLDRELDLWRDGETSYYSVNCWRRLADNVRASLRKGDPVIVKGRFRTRTYTDKEGKIRTEAEIVADSIGHDLSRGIANFLRPMKSRPETAGEGAEGADDARGPDDPGEDQMMPGAGIPPFADPGSGVRVEPERPEERNAEETVGNFTQGMDDDEAMARELGESREATEPALPF
jgi:single-strand DNA-binding protein